MNGTLINEIDFKALKDLDRKREKLRQEEKDTKAYHFSNDAEMGFKHFNAKAQRKQVEKQIFKLIKTL